jgi:hypothetical protein
MVRRENNLPSRNASLAFKTSGLESQNGSQGSPQRMEKLQARVDTVCEDVRDTIRMHQAGKMPNQFLGSWMEDRLLSPDGILSPLTDKRTSGDIWQIGCRYDRFAGRKDFSTAHVESPINCTTISAHRRVGPKSAASQLGVTSPSRTNVVAPDCVRSTTQSKNR